MTDRNRQLAPRALASSLGVPLKWCSISSGPQTTKQLPLLKGHRTSRKTLQHHLTPISLPRHLTPGLPIVSSKVRLKQFQPRLEPQRHALLHSLQRPNQKAGRETGCVRACVCACVRVCVCVCVCVCWYMDSDRSAGPPCVVRLFITPSLAWEEQPTLAPLDNAVYL